MNPNEQLNEQEEESVFGEAEPEGAFELNGGFSAHSITGGKGPGALGEVEGE